MPLTLLFPHFHDLIRTPADVQRLNEAILQLAVQGKLVPQDPDDEPASELLKRIEAEKKRLVKAKKIRKSKPLAPIQSEDLPHELPEGWTWVHLGQIVTLWNGRAYKRSELLDAGTPIIRIQNLNGGHNWYYSDLDLPEEKYCDDGDLLYAWSGTFGPYIWQGGRAIYHYHIWRIDLYEDLVRDYVFYLLKAVSTDVKDDAHGIMLLHMTKGGMEELIVPLPPLAEQKRIVAKVEELFAQTRALEAKLRQAQADIVVVNQAALHRLQSAGDNGQRQAAWATVADHFDLLYSDARNVAELRQTILQLAVQGKLVPQNRDDEPASELLKRIETEKKQLVEEKRIRKAKPLPPIKPEEVPYQLSEGWEWAKLGDVVVETNTGPFGSMLHKSDYVENGIPVVNPANIQNGRIEIISKMTVDDATRGRLSRYILEEGDIVIGRRGEMGRCALITARETGWLCGSGSFVLKTSQYTYRPFLIKVIRSPHSREYLSGSSVGATMNNLNHRILNNLVVGLPPLAEQELIVAKVDQLMALCDALEAKLGQEDAEGRVLVEAVLAGAT